MSIGRRISSDSRRRRVLLYQSSREGDRRTGTDRRTVEKLRLARRPASIYGARVNRRLRGRWFSLVPVRRRAMAAASVAVLGTALLLCLAHWLAISWQPLAYREALARPLRLDRPDSFGTWARVSLLAVAAGTSLLVYQLRRYRSDDYRGSYRIWPPVIIVTALASLDGIVALVPWCGELIDLLLGKRVAMAGSDWIRIGITVGGAALALRLIAEVRHSKLSVLMMMLAVICFAIPFAAHWGVLLSDTPLKWWLISSAPLMAAATLCVSCGAYLRMLFREVRGLDQGDQLSLRFQQWKARTFPAKVTEAADPAQPPAAKRAADKPKAAAAPSEPTTSKPASKLTGDDKPAKAPGASDAKPAAKPPRSGTRRFAWLFGRGKRPDSGSPASNPAVAKQKPQSPAPSATPDAAAPASAAAPVGNAAKPTPESADTSKEAAAPKRRAGLGAWLRRNKSATTTPDGQPQSASAAKTNGGSPSASPPAAATRPDDADDGAGDDASIDWASMGKAERRRLRRELKRSGDAA